LVFLAKLVPFSLKPLILFHGDCAALMGRVRGHCRLSKERGGGWHRSRRCGLIPGSHLDTGSKEATLATWRPPQLILALRSLDSLCVSIQIIWVGAGVDKRREAVIQNLPLFSLPLGDLFTRVRGVLLERVALKKLSPASSANSNPRVRIVLVLDIK
jgi:hypothetical protein